MVQIMQRMGCEEEVRIWEGDLGRTEMKQGGAIQGNTVPITRRKDYYVPKEFKKRDMGKCNLLGDGGDGIVG